MIGDPYEDRPASHAAAHVSDERCSCHGKTEAELAAPYAAFVLVIVTISIVALVLAVVFG